jgi:two-component sensor histidine kinase
MAARPPLHLDGVLSLALAVVAASSAPLLLLDGDLKVVAASTSFCRAFQIEPDSVAGCLVFALGAGEWNLPRLRSLLTATISGGAEVAAYELDLRSDRGVRRLVLNAHMLDYDDKAQVRLLLTVADVTDARHTAKLKDDLLREKAILLQEVQHRVANSLQIIASVLLQSARKVQSEETRGHLNDAHNRVMSIAAVQQQLAASRIGAVALRPYLVQLCQSLGASMIIDHDKVSVTVTVDDSAVDADISISLGLIVTELVINALKHAFPGGRDGKIRVDYETVDGDWTLSIRDDGVGMPKNAADAKPGLGTSIVEALANQLSADVRVTGAAPGTRVSIVHTQALADDPVAPAEAA